MKDEGQEGRVGKSDSLPLKHWLMPAVLASAFFITLFTFPRSGPLDFWWRLSAVIVLLNLISFALHPPFYRFVSSDLKSRPMVKIFFGVLSALMLFGFFCLAKLISLWAFPFAAIEIGRVYGIKMGASAARIGLLLGLVIGPGEELFWRGYLQRAWALRAGALTGCLFVSALYTAVHLGSGNFMLVAGAAACGLAWGFLFLITRSVLVTAVSHALWDILVFLLFPFA